MKFNQSFHSPLELNVRTGFVRKVYGILSTQLIATTMICYLARSISLIKNLILVFHVPAALGTIIISLWLFLSQTASKEVPKNYILLSLFTLFESLSVSGLIFYIDPQIIFTALVLTAGMTLTLTAYAFTTKKDFTMSSGAIWIVLGSLIMSIMMLFNPSARLYFIYLLFGVISFGFYLIYDTQLIMGGKHKQVGLDNYILASMMLYIDIIQLFLKIVKILNDLQSKENQKKENK